MIGGLHAPSERCSILLAEESNSASEFGVAESTAAMPSSAANHQFASNRSVRPFTSVCAIAIYWVSMSTRNYREQGDASKLSEPTDRTIRSDHCERECPRD